MQCNGNIVSKSKVCKRLKLFLESRVRKYILRFLVNLLIIIMNAFVKRKINAPQMRYIVALA